MMSQICRCDNNYNSIDDKDNDNDNDDIMIITKKTSRTCHNTPNNDNKRVRYITLPSPLLCDSDDMSHHHTHMSHHHTRYITLPSPLLCHLCLSPSSDSSSSVSLTLSLSPSPSRSPPYTHTLLSHASLPRLWPPSQITLNPHASEEGAERVATWILAPPTA